MSAEARFDGGQGKMATGALRIALAGNPNCGKTTVFNAYTGARQHVGNYPGVTVDRKEGHVRHGNADITLVDLPGTYSLTAYSMEELVARAELGSGDVQAVINVVDASALERNLLLTVQMMEMGLPVVLVCNMMDEARKAGVHIDMDRLSRMMGIPVVPPWPVPERACSRPLARRCAWPGKGSAGCWRSITARTSTRGCGPCAGSSGVRACCRSMSPTGSP